MAARRQKVIHDVEVEHAAGRLSWTSGHIKALIAPYPKRGHMDTLKEFQDDEYPPLTDGQEESEDAEQQE